MKMRFLPDEPITKEQEEDVLEFGEFVELLQNSIYNTETPFVYGVLGDWGVGKTSILRLLQNQLAKDVQNGTRSFIPIWFNAWQYENETNLIYPLLYAIKGDYIHRFKELDKAKSFWKQFTDVALTCTVAFADLGLRVVTKQLTGEALKIDEVAKQLEMVKENPGKLEGILSEWADQVAGLRGAFEGLLEIYAGDLAMWPGTKIRDKDGVRFVILIDDLDRCLPETTIAILECIKNYLTVKNCVFILGLNPGVIYQGIRVKYKGLEVDGREYLEKILNYSFYVPEPKLNKVAEFVTKRFETLVLEDEARTKYKAHFAEFGRILEECRFNNPRKIKRILNRYLFFISKNEKDLAKYPNANIVRWILLAEYFPGLFQLFLKNNQTVSTIKEELRKIGEPAFDVEGFEKKFGISIKAIYPQLSRMGKLFDLDLSTTGGKLDPAAQAQEVFSITRLV